jgi:hypothetical protein
VKIEHYDLTKGEYGVTVSVGKSYQTKMQQGLDTLGQLIQAAPDLFPVLGYRWMQFNDSIPGHEEIAEDLKKLRPPQLQDDDQAEPEKLKQQLAQLGQQHEILVKELNAKNQIIETDQVKTQGDLDKAKIDQQTKIEVAKLERDTKIVTAAISAKMADSKVLQEIEASAIELLMTQEHAAAEAEKARAHEAALGAADHAGALEQGRWSTSRVWKRARWTISARWNRPTPGTCRRWNSRNKPRIWHQNRRRAHEQGELSAATSGGVVTTPRSTVDGSRPCQSALISSCRLRARVRTAGGQRQAI